MKVIHWKSKITGKTGHGLPLDDAEADMWVTIQNKKHLYIDHWAEPVDESDES